ncbi:MAG: type II/IV secretion system protein [Candidatus Nomurabacteria bacterium]|nr:type II/IV secretion system protein [Candidatus Saccharibacteria bacterium]USN95756.1 MAG: type II/IV secretion system protein [Candidatus Nomurabacteria bacterium]
MSVLSVETQEKVENALVEQNLILQSKINQLKEKAKKDNTPFFSLLVSEGGIPDEVLTKTIAHVGNIPYVNLSEAIISSKVLGLLPKEIAERYMAVPLGEMQHRLVVGMLDPDNVQAIDYLSNKIGRPVKVFAASETGIHNVLKQYKNATNAEITSAYPSGQAPGGGIDLSSDLKDFKGDEDVAPGLMQNSAIKTISQDSPISKILSAILEYAANNGASDIHIEPLERELQIRCRIDGVLREVMKLPKATEPPLVSRVKILSSLKIDEHRLPQDGQFTVSVTGREIDLRIAISPVVWGEQVVIRLLDKTGTSLKLEDMGYKGRALRTIRRALEHPNGMVLTSGPTGSGKSTSMYALLQEIKNDSINIVTLEDPVEYKMQGINQIQVNADVGLTFASGLRSILRQDPDVVMVGEIRDKETATLAVQAALTGHLVFSTLHTNSAAGILPRLLDMGIEPFLIASTVRTVIGQRLVRRLADGAEPYSSNTAETTAIHQVLSSLLPKNTSEVKKFSEDIGYKTLPLVTENAYTLYKGKESASAPGGYKGRMGLYEVFDVTPEIQQLILKRATSSEIQKVAIAQGMVSMRQDGYLKALSGLTTIDEVNRVAAEDSA